MNKGVRILLSLIMGLAGFLFLNKEYQLLGYDIPFFSVPHGMVRVDFINDGDETIESISIDTIDEPIRDIAVGERRSVTFEHIGEGSYHFKATFISGKEVEGEQTYIEAGYFLTERVK